MFRKLGVAMLGVATVTFANVGAQAATIATNPTYNFFYTPGSVIPGQSFTTTGTGFYNNIDFKFIGAYNQKVGAGNLYLFSSAYAGAATDLATAGALGSAAYNSGTGSYTFGSDLVLSADTTYYAYADTGFGVALDLNNGYSGGASLAQPSGLPGFIVQSGYDTAFTVAGTASDGPATISVAGVPEPASWALMLTGFGAVGFGMRRRKRTSATFG